MSVRHGADLLWLAEKTLPLRWRQIAGRRGMTVLCALCLAAPALAGSELAMGDGSNADNARLLPGIYPEAPVLENGAGLAEPYDPFFDVDWSVALRGTYTKATAGERFDIRLVPRIGLEHIGTRSAISLDGSAEIVRPNGGNTIDIGALRLGLKAGYDLDSVTRVTANGNLALTQAVAGTPGLAANIAIAPQTLAGGIDAGITRQFGKFNIGVTGAVQRSAYGETTLTNGTVTSNLGQNYTALDAGLRVGFQATPIFEVFGVAGIGRDIFDTAGANATDATIEAGIAGRWNTILEAKASAGLALRRFDATGMGEIVTQLYNAQVTFTPDPTWRMTAGLATTVAPPGPDGTGTTRIDYVANAELGYTVNSWLALRALADWNVAQFAGSTDTQSGYGLGLGADYKVNANTAMTADYGFVHSTSTANGIQEAHRVTVGITLSR